MHYLLDTNICIYLIKKRRRKFLSNSGNNHLMMSPSPQLRFSSWSTGGEKSQYRQRSQDALAKFFLPLNLVEMDPLAATEAAVIRAELERKGMPIGPYDLLIAGVARSKNMTLVTNNTKEFERIDGLPLANWVQ